MGNSPRARWIITILAVCALAAVWISLRIATSPLTAAPHSSADTVGSTSPTAYVASEYAAIEPQNAPTRWLRLIDRSERQALAGATVLVTRTGNTPRSFVSASDGIVNADLVDADTLRVEHPGWFPIEIGVSELRSKNHTPDVLEIALDRACGLEVLVVDARSRPLPGVFVEVFPIDPATGAPPAELPALWPRSIEPGDHPETDDYFHVHPLTDEHGRVLEELLPRGVPLLVIAGKRPSTIEQRIVVPLDQTSLSVTLQAP